MPAPRRVNYHKAGTQPSGPPMTTPKFSIIIPARNEERMIGQCLESIRTAAAGYADQVETIVVLNRCTDGTAEIAHAYGARTVREDARNLAKIRNAGARSAGGEILVTIDADSRMSPNMLRAIDRALSSHSTVGGGTVIRPDRTSPGIRLSLLVFNFFSRISRLSCGLFWCYRRDFESIGGFNERLVSAEDVDFARRLKAHGKRVKRPFSTLRDAYIVTSCRKFDAFGDWCVFRNPALVYRLLRGNDQRGADAFYYDFKR
jgi:glycosyltransferase involved in cell wall biosynthesis